MHYPRLSILAAAVALAGCVHIPADTSRAALADAAVAQHAPSIRLARDAWPEAQWWNGYGDAQLAALVAQALKDNPALPAAQARLDAARAAVAGAQAEGGLDTGATAGLNRQRYSANGLFPEPIGGAWFNDASVQLRAGYDFDWWGKHRAQVAAALGEANAREAEAAQAAQTLAAAVAQSYLRLQMLWAREDNARAIARDSGELVSDRKARIAHGLANADALRRAEHDLATANEQAERHATQAAREREVLRALVGAGSDGLPELARRLPSPAVAALPTRLGVELLARRPDLQAARWRVAASLGRIKASEAAFYPDLNLAGAIGLNSVSLNKLLQYGSRTLLAGATLALPLFDSKRLDAQLGAARAGRDEMIADYNQSVLAAVRDVAAEAATLQGISRQQQAQGAAYQASQRLAANAQARLKAGLADRAEVLQARLAVLRQHDLGLQLADAQLQTQVALTKALGGGYTAYASNQPDLAHAP